jgi:thiamine pyrophosphate-dependent acetolactate synthase large subunit-like protein
MKNCDTVFIIGSTMPWFEYYPKPGQARGVQLDMKPDRIGLRYPVEIGLVGDAKATLTALIPLLQRQSDRFFLKEAQNRMADWNRLLAVGRNDLTRPFASPDGDQSGQRPDRRRRRDLAGLRREHAFRGA